MTSLRITWPFGSLADRVISAISDRFGRLTGRSDSVVTHISREDFFGSAKRPGTHVSVRLSRQDAFVQKFNGRATSSGDLKKIVENEAQRLCPVLAGDMILLAHPARDASGEVDLVHVRASDMEEIEAKARALGLASVSLSAEDAPELIFSSPSSLIRTHREHRLWAIALLAVIASMMLALAGLEHSLGQAAELASEREALLRAELLERRETEREIGALGAIAGLSPDARSPAGRLSSLAELNEKTPQSAWWIRAEMTGTRTRLTGLSDNAATVLNTLTEALPNKSIRFDETVSDTAEGKQKFVIQITERTE